MDPPPSHASGASGTDPARPPETSDAAADPSAERTLAPSTRWWGSLTLEPDTHRRWRIGPRTLWLVRRARELTVAHTMSDDPLDDALELAEPADPEEIPENATRLRFALRADAPSPVLHPVLAERAAVMRPEAQLTVPEGEEVTLYVGTPLWLTLTLPAQGERGERALLELSSWRPSDTWFGPDTLRGELAYALSTAGRFTLDDVPPSPHRAITPIRVRNHAREPLQIQRLKVPLPYLTLYWAGERFWTTAVTLEHQEDDDRDTVQLTRGAPDEAAAAERVAAPRLASGGSLVMRAFSRIFGSD